VEDLEQGGTDDIAGADASDSSKDLAFLGYTFKRFTISNGA